MSRFLKVFLRDPLSARVQVAGFGKHPAWDDHIDDPGLTTETLVLTKQLLYSEGIATQLASGTWDQIEKSGNAIEFDHRFVWAREKQTIVGAIWASADRKGRTRFPLVICAQADLGDQHAIDLLFDPIERLGTVCRAAKTQEEIREIFSRTQCELNDAAPHSLSANFFSDLPDSEETSIQPSLVTLSAGLKSRRPRGSREAVGTSGPHFRLAAISSQEKMNLRFWCAYLAAQHVGPGLPYLVIAATGRRWIDLLVGEPQQNDLFCLRANENALPTTWTEVAGSELHKLESEAAEYLRTYKFGTTNLSSQRRSWWSGLFNK
jgi:hypothetical protein